MLVTRSVLPPPTSSETTEGGGQGQWILVETLGAEPSAVAVGDRPKRLVPLRSVLRRNPNLSFLTALLKDAGKLEGGVRAFPLRGDRVAHVNPVATDDGHVHGAQFWIGERDQDPPPRPPGAAWLWNLSTHESISGEESRRAVGVAPELWRPRRSIAEDFELFTPAIDELEAFVVAAHWQADKVFTSAWACVLPVEKPVYLQFAARRTDEPDDAGRVERLLRGVSTSVTLPPRAEPQQDTIAQQLIVAERAPGTHRALVNLRNLLIWRWWDDPLPGLLWRHTADGRPAIHPDDIEKAKAARAAVAQGEVSVILRARAEGGGWIAVRMTANLVNTQQAASAAFVALSLA